MAKYRVLASSARWSVLAILFTLGCSRGHYRLQADHDAYSAIGEKTASTPWLPPSDYTIHPHPASRLYSHTPLDDPALPLPSPQLYAYEVPELGPRDPARFHRQNETQGFGEGEPTEPFALAGHFNRLPSVNTRLVSGIREIDSLHRAYYQVQADEGAPPPGSSAGQDSEIRVAPIPVEAWEVIPPNCRRRMFDFESLLAEADLTRESSGQDVTMASSDGRRLSLEDIIELALMNSREYQTQKENLYRVALRLSLQRFDYQLNFSPTGHRTSSNFTHSRNAGATVNSLGIPTTVSGQRILTTGGDLLARFANNVLLTFNGPQGFAADVGSDILLDLGQPIFQRDIGFEPLTQAERDVLYAARDFARFRKQFFVQLAAQYYNLIRRFRQIEIDSQNYFSLVRALNRAEAEFRPGFVPRVQVDQVEQNLLNGRRQLISTCNELEQSLDDLKIAIGLPVELPLNLDLTELEQLTKRDQLAVTGDLIGRVRRRLLRERQVTSTGQDPERVVLLSTAVVLIERALEANDLRTALELPPFEISEYRLLRARMQVELSRLTAQEISLELDEQLASDSPPPPPIVFQRTMALIDALAATVERHLTLAELLLQPIEDIARYRGDLQEIVRFADGLRGRFQGMLEGTEPLQLEELVDQAENLRSVAQRLIVRLDGFNQVDDGSDASLRYVDRLLAEADQILEEIGGGLVPVEIGVDDAMMTALVLRFELMNERGFLADDWRQIKLAGDDLRSVLNLNASQAIRTRADVNRPFDFTWDESQTALQLTFDAPLNRRAQRNNYRSALINYQVAVRSLMQLEDNIKRAVRNDLRSLDLDREQYRIGVAGAALAYERVVSTRLEFFFGTGQVSARDFLEAQTAYAAALSAVADRHIGYILDRTQLFFDLELLTVGDDGFWQELYSEEYQPEPYYQLPIWAEPYYGDLPPVWYSKEIHRMLHVPPGSAAIHGPAEPMGEASGDGVAPELVAPPAPTPGDVGPAY